MEIACGSLGILAVIFFVMWVVTACDLHSTRERQFSLRAQLEKSELRCDAEKTQRQQTTRDLEAEKRRVLGIQAELERTQAQLYEIGAFVSGRQQTLDEANLYCEHLKEAKRSINKCLKDYEE